MALVSAIATAPGLPLNFYPSQTAQAPVPTATIQVKVGSTSFTAGDADFFGFKPLWEQVCDGVGCDEGTPVSFDYNINSLGLEETTSGNFVMSGFVNNNSVVTIALLNVIETTLLKSQQCTTTRGQKCAFKNKRSRIQGRDSGPVLRDCNDESLNDCTYANFVQATVFDTESNAEAHVEMKGTSGDTGAFDCDSVFDIVNAGTTTFDADPIVAGGVSVAQIACNAIFGGS